jgi:hypothetical protein
VGQAQVWPADVLPCPWLAMQPRDPEPYAIPSLVERFRNVAISASKSRVMGDCQARFREGLGCDSPAYSIRFFNRDLLMLCRSLRPGQQNRYGHTSGGG